VSYKLWTVGDPEYGVVPILQGQDGTFLGVGLSSTTSLDAFDQNGNVKWCVPNLTPVIATADGGLAQGERSPAVLCQSIKPIHGEDGRIVQIMGRSAGVNEDVNRRAGLALMRQPAGRMRSLPAFVCFLPSKRSSRLRAGACPDSSGSRPRLELLHFKWARPPNRTLSEDSSDHKYGLTTR
jgi:hypothetical protein